MERVIEERLRARERAVQEARGFARCVSERLGAVTAVLFRSYARGDFNEWSDIDVLVVARSLPRNPLERLDLVRECLTRFPRVEPVVVTVEEFKRMKGRNPAIAEATQKGILLVDELDLVDPSGDPP